MATIRLQTRKFGGELQALIERVKKPLPMFRDWARAVRLSMTEEFRQETYFRRGGGRQKWVKTHAFGNKPAPQKTGQDTGRLYRSVSGGPGYVEKITARQVEIGTTVEYAQYFRGGFGQRPKVGKWSQEVNAAMTGLFLKKYRILIKTGSILNYHYRPYGSIHPKLLGTLTRITVAYVTSGKSVRFSSRNVSA